MFGSGFDDVLNVANLNSPGSNYAALFGKDTTKFIAEEIKKAILDDTPEDMYEVPLLYMNPARVVPKAEFSWFEMQVQRVPIETPILDDTVAEGTVQKIYINNPTDITIDTIVAEVVTNEQATVIDVSVDEGWMKIKSQTGTLLSEKTSGESYKFVNQSTIDADHRTNITQGYRMNKTIERFNFVQQFSLGTEFGREEMWTYMNAGTTNYVEMNRSQLRKQFVMGLTLQFINGKRGEFTLSDNKVAKGMGGVYPSMLQAGSPQLETTMENVVDGLFKLGFLTRFGKGQQTKFLLAKPETISQISRTVKTDKMRWEATNDFGAQFELEAISDASNKIVLVPCGIMGGIGRILPDFFEDLGLLLDYSSIRPVIMWDMRVGGLESREKNNNTLNTFSIEYIETTLSQEFTNPLGSGILKLV